MGAPKTEVYPDMNASLVEEAPQERQYDYRQKLLRDNFVREYLVDFDSTAAARRLGYNDSLAKEYGQKLLNEPYVAREVSRLSAVTETTEEDEAAVKKRIMGMLMREANDRGPGSTQAARVAALGKIAQLMGMEPAKTNINQLTGPNGEPLQGAGQFVIPGVMTPQQWAEAAAAQQESLVNGSFKQVPQVAPPVIE